MKGYVEKNYFFPGLNYFTWLPMFVVLKLILDFPVLSPIYPDLYG